MLSLFLTWTKCCSLESFPSSATGHFFLLFPWTSILNVVSKDTFEVLLLFLICFFRARVPRFVSLCRLHCRLAKNSHFHKDHLYIYLSVSGTPIHYILAFNTK